MASDQEGRESRRSGGGKYCVAGGPGSVSCTNGQHMEGVSIHHFPDQNKDKDLYQGRRNRSDHSDLGRTKTLSFMVKALYFQSSGRTNNC